MNFRTVYCETAGVILCLVSVIGLVTDVRAVENVEDVPMVSSSDGPGSEIGSSQGTHSHGKPDSSNKRGLESSMAYPQGYFPPYHSSNEMQYQVTPPYNRDYDQELAKKQLYFERSIGKGQMFITRRNPMRRTLVTNNVRPPLYSNQGYFVTTQGNSYGGDQGTYNSDGRQFTPVTSDGSYNEATYRQTQNDQPVADYPRNYPTYVYGYDTQKSHPIRTPTYQSYQPSYEPSYEFHRGVGSAEHERGYADVPREYANPTYNPNTPTFVYIQPEREPVEEMHKYHSETSQNDRMSALQYQIQVLRALEEQKQRLLQDINDQTHRSPTYHPTTSGTNYPTHGSPAYYPTPTATIHRRMVPQFPVGAVMNPSSDYFLSGKALSPQFQTSEGSRRDRAFLINPTNRQIMPTRIPYLVDDRNVFPFIEPRGRNSDATGIRNSYLMTKNKRDNDMVATNCGQAMSDEPENIVACGSAIPLTESPFGQGNFWNYFEQQSSKHLFYHSDATPPVFPPVDIPPMNIPPMNIPPMNTPPMNIPPMLPGDILPCRDPGMCDGGPGKYDEITGGNMGSGMTEPSGGDESSSGPSSVPSSGSSGDNGPSADHKPTQHFNTSCGNQSKITDQEKEQQTTITTTTTTITTTPTIETTSSTTSTTEEDTNAISNTTTMSSTDNYGTVGDEAVGAEAEAVDDKKPENVSFPDPMMEDDGTKEGEDYNEAIYSVDPREIRE